MGINKIKTLALISLLSLSAFCSAQSLSNHTDTLKKMENKILIGEIFVPENSVMEFLKQNVTSSFLKKQPGFVNGQLYERVDDSGNLHWITITTWLNQEAYENAQKSLKEYYKSIKFSPMAFREKLNITAEHELYTLSAY